MQSADQHHHTPPPRSLLLRCWSNSRCCFEGPAWSSEHSVGGIEPVGSAPRHYAGASIPIESGAVTGAKKASAIARRAATGVSRCGEVGAPLIHGGPCLTMPVKLANL